MSFNAHVRLRPRGSGHVVARVSVALAVVCAFVPRAGTRSEERMPDYKNPRLPVERRVADLLGRMTLEEKVAQLVCLWVGRTQVAPQPDFSTDRGDFDPQKAREGMK